MAAQLDERRAEEIDRLPLICIRMVSRMPLEPGDKAPDFTLFDQEGNPFSLSKSLNTRKVRHFVYFYPGA